jgi:sugar phosphate isomerase/epimerase
VQLDAETVARCVRWVVETLGEPIARSRRERALRLLEESCELAQSLGVTETECGLLARRVWSRPTGAAPQEAAGVLFTLLVLADAIGADLGAELERELERVEDPAMRERIREKHRGKVDIGVGEPLPGKPASTGLRRATGRRTI